jgi:hypothetical protein
MKRVCKVDGCSEQSQSLGLCRLHYKRFKKHGDPTFMHKGVCPNCNTEFEAKYSFQKWCSKDCNRQANQKRQWADWYARNSKRHIDHNRAYYVENRNFVLKRTKQWAEQRKLIDPDIAKKMSRKWRYGISHEQFLSLIERQNGRCRICQFVFELDSDKTKMPYVDHNHDNGQVRALLCHHCNLVIGHAKENPLIIQSAIDYLERNR